MRTNNKYNYILVIQQRYAAKYGFEDVSEYEADSQGNAIDRLLFRHDLKEHKMLGYPTRVVFRREKK